MHIAQFKPYLKQTLLALMVVGFIALSASMASAQSSITKSYIADQELTQGSVVSNVPGDESKIATATLDTEQYLLGVVQVPNRALLEIVEEDRPVLVAESGQVDVLVSNIDGDIEAGDFVSVSVIEGVASKSIDQKQVLGIALENFNVNETTKILRDISNEVTEVEAPESLKLGRIKVDVNIQDNPNYKPVGGLVGLVETVAEKLEELGISPVRFAMAALLFMTGVSVIGALIYGSIKSSIISLGRNPMGRRLIFGGLLQVFGLSVVVLVATIVALYLVLTL